LRIKKSRIILFFLLSTVIAVLIFLAIPEFEAAKSYKQYGVHSVTGKEELSDYIGKWVSMEYDYTIDAMLSCGQVYESYINWGTIKLAGKEEYVFITTRDLFFSEMKDKNYYESSLELEQHTYDSTCRIMGYVTYMDTWRMDTLERQFFTYKNERRMPNTDENTNNNVFVQIKQPSDVKAARNTYLGYLCVLFAVWGFLLFLIIKNLTAVYRAKKERVVK